MLSPVPRPIVGAPSYRWLIENLGGDACIVVPPAASADPQDPSPHAEAEAAPLHRATDVYIQRCERATVELMERFKAVHIEGCKQTAVQLPGAVASLELLRCSRCKVVIDQPLSCVRLDDCHDVQLELSYAAWVGFVAGDRHQDEAGASGFHLFTTGSHAVRVSYPLSDAPDAPRREHAVSEMIHTRLGVGGAVATAVNGASPWGGVG